VARRLSDSIGEPVQIGELRVDLLGTSFHAREVQVGPRGRPLLSLPRASVKLRLKTARQGGGDAPLLRAEVSLRAPSGSLWGLPLSGVRLDGWLTAGRLEVERLTLGLLGGSFTLAGVLASAGRGRGSVRLKGEAVVPRSGSRGPLKGRIWLRGKSPRRLTLGGRLRGPSPPRGRGTLAGDARVRLRLRLGRRRLVGNSRRWRIR
jgi:hypothetical protein